MPLEVVINVGDIQERLHLARRMTAVLLTKKLMLTAASQLVLEQRIAPSIRVFRADSWNPPYKGWSGEVGATLGISTWLLILGRIVLGAVEISPEDFAT